MAFLIRNLRGCDLSQLRFADRWSSWKRGHGLRIWVDQISQAPPIPSFYLVFDMDENGVFKRFGGSGLMLRAVPPAGAVEPLKATVGGVAPEAAAAYRVAFCQKSLPGRDFMPGQFTNLKFHRRNCIPGPLRVATRKRYF